MKIEKVIEISNEDIVASIQNMSVEHRMEILEMLISMESTEKQKWNLITSGRLLTKRALSEPNANIIISECNKIIKRLQSKEYEALPD